MDRQYLRPRMSGAGTVVSDDRYGSRTSEWPETDGERGSNLRSQPVKSILRRPNKLQMRPRRNSDSSVTSNLPAVGSDTETVGPSTPPPTSSSGILPRKVFKAKFTGAIPEERRGVVNLRPSRASTSSVQSGYHVPPVRTVLSPSYVPDSEQLDQHDRRISRERNERHGYSDRDRDPETESVSESSELSTTTQATTVASALSDFEGSDVTPTEAPTKSSVSQVRFTPSVIGSSSSVVSSSPPSRKVRPRLGTRVRTPSEVERPTAKSNGRAVNIKLLPPSPAQSGELKLQRAEKNQKDAAPARTLVHKVEQLEAEARGLRLSQARLEKELEDSSSVISSSGKEKEAAVKERDRERTDKAELIGMLQEQTAIVDEYRSNLELQKGLLDEVEKERDAERAAKAELQAKLDANKKLLEEFSCSFELQKVMLTEAEKERDEIKGAKDKSDAKCVILEEDIKTSRQDRKAQEDMFIQQVVALEIIKESLQSQSDNKTKEIDELFAERDRLKDEVAALTGQVTALTDDKKTMEEELQKAKTVAQEEQQALKTQIEELEKTKEDLETVKATLEEERTELQAKLDTAQGEINTLNTRVEELEASATEFDTRITGKEEEITRLQAQAADLTSQLDGLTNDKADLQKQIEDLEAEKKKTQAELHTLDTDLAGSKAANVSLATHKLELQEYLDAAKAEIATLTGDKASLQPEADKVPDLESAKAELEAKVSELESKLGELQAEADKVPGLSTEKDEVSSKAAELESKIAGLEAKITELQTEADKAASLAEAKSSMEAELADLQSKISTLQSELDRDPDMVTAALKAEVEANRQEIARRVEEISSLTESNSTLSTQLGATQQQLSAVQQSLDSVTASYGTATGQVIELQQRVEQLSVPSGGLRSRRGSRSRNSSPQKKGDGKKDKQLVVVRNPTDRGAVAVMLQIVGGM